MAFSNLIFLYLFLPLCLIAYFCVRSLRAKIIVLQIFSVLSDAWGEPMQVLVLPGSAALNYAAGLWMGLPGEKQKKGKKALLIRAAASTIRRL